MKLINFLYIKRRRSVSQKEKLSKKEIQEDKLVTAYYGFIRFSEKNQSKIFMVAGAVAVIILAIVFFNNRKIENNSKAGAQLSKVISKFSEGNYQEAIDGVPGTDVIGLSSIVNNYGGTEQGEIARLFLANSYFGLGKIDEALKEYSDFSGSNSVYKASAIAGEASCYESKGEFEKAATLYIKASNVNKNNSQNAEYILSAGINYNKLGNKAKAKELFESIKNDYATSQAAREIDRFLVQVN